MRSTFVEMFIMKLYKWPICILLIVQSVDKIAIVRTRVGFSM